MIAYTLSFLTWASIFPLISFILAFFTNNLVISVAILTFLALYLVIPMVHVRIRANPLCGCKCQKYKIVIGGGWSFFLNKKPSYSHEYDVKQGRISKDWWYAGTTIGKVQEILAKENQTLASHPSVKTSTLGGWIFSNSHGSGGTLWKPQFKSVKVEDQESGEILIRDPKQLFDAKKTIEEQRRFIIKEVEISSVPNKMTFRTVFKMNTEQDAFDFLNEESYIRFCQIGKRGTMCLLWTPSGALEAEKSRIGKLSLWFQADVLSAWQKKSSHSWFPWPVQPVEKWNRVVSLKEANDFTPSPFPLFASFALGYKNFELFIDYTIEYKQLFRLCKKLETLLIDSRCELRCGKNRLFLDFGCPIWFDTKPLIELLQKEFKNTNMWIHKGKYQNVFLK
jgi:hypothetical protein